MKHYNILGQIMKNHDRLGKVSEKNFQNFEHYPNRGVGSGGQWSNFLTSFGVFLNYVSKPSLGIIFHKITYILKKITHFLMEWSKF